MVKIACLSDTHGQTPTVPDADVLLLAGDYIFTRKGDIPAQIKFINGKFHQWIEEIAARMPIYMCAGNHDEIFEKHYDLINPFPDNVKYLEDSGTKWNNLNIWGSPQTLYFYNWSFNQRPNDIKRYWDMIPSNIDILLCHQPPFGVADIVPRMNPAEDESIFDGEHVGCPSLRDRILEVQPKLVVTGHLHSGYGIHSLGDSLVVGASYVGEDYKPKNKIIIIDI